MPGGLSTTPAISARMARQARRDTAPEVALRRTLHRRGRRFRIEWPLPGLPRRRADLCFPRQRIVIFVDGCFWHRCPTHGTSPWTNGDWWSAKLDANVLRDRETDSTLQAQGWTVLRFWEHEDPELAADQVEQHLPMRRGKA